MSISSRGGRPEAELGVVHLVRKVNGEPPLQRFLDSYRRRSAGLAHDLVLLLKGFASDDEAEPYRALAADVSSRSISVVDAGYDIGAYLAAARQLEYRRLCFLNSFSEILVDDWLVPLAGALSEPRTGLAGATGSWGSQRSHLRYDLGLGGPYADLLGDRRHTREQMKTLAPSDGDGSSRLRTLRHRIRTAFEVPRRWMGFESFPAHHVRTNGFLVTRDVMTRIEAGRLRGKLDLYLLESGRHSVTRQVEAMGLRAVVVGRDGRSYEHPAWAGSYTLWQGNQENLLIADNQSRSYDQGDLGIRTLLSRYAWGSFADPSRE